MKRVDWLFETVMGAKIKKRYPKFSVMRYKYSDKDFCAVKQENTACPSCAANSTLGQEISHKRGVPEGLTSVRRLCDCCSGFFSDGEHIGVCGVGHLFHMACWKPLAQRE